VFRPRVILGPPGCGKTQRLLGLLDEELEGGTPPQRIAFVTFTRAARREVQGRVRSRFELGEDALPWLRTIHSAAYRLLELGGGRILDDKAWAKFGERYGYRFTPQGRYAYDPDGDPGALLRRTDEDLVRYVYDWGRNCRLTPEQTLARCPVEGLKATLFRSFVERLERFKRVENHLDFTDLLERVLSAGLRPDVDVAFTDESQDLSPLQAAVCEAWFEPCERSYVAGDEDQAVYSFQGADPSWLLELARRREPEILRQSHRVPVAAHAFAVKAIRQNKMRVEKEYAPTQRAGRVVHAERGDLLRYLDPEVETFVLARNRIYLAPIACQLLELGFPYVVEGLGGPSPLSDERLLRAIGVARAIAAPEAERFFAKDVKALLHQVPVGSGLASRAAKTKVKDLAKEGGFLAWSELVDLGLQPLLDLIDREGPLAFLPPRKRAYFERLFERYGRIPTPKIVLTTMHGSKGREATRVIVIPDMSRATWHEYTRGGQAGFEAENRVFYVAMTRAKEELVLLSPRGRRHFEFPRLDLVEGVV